jgi:hypothetical protein
VTKSRGIAKRFTREEITEALQLAAYYRSAKKAADVMAERGVTVTPGTINAWQTKHADIHEAALTRIDEVLAERSEHLVREATELEIQLLGDLAERRDELDAKDIASALRNVSTTKGITFERVVGPIRGRPNVVIEHREPTKLLEEMARIAEMVRPSVEGSAVELPDAQVLEGGE